MAMKLPLGEVNFEAIYNEALGKTDFAKSKRIVLVKGYKINVTTLK
jgi:hypothetical protein